MARSPRRILKVCSAREAIYGASLSMITLAEALRAAGDHVEFVTFGRRMLGHALEARGFCVHRVSNRLGKLDLGTVLAIRAAARAMRADILHGHLSTACIAAGLAARLARLPGVVTAHGMSSHASFRTAHRIIAVSHGVKRHLVGQGLRPERIDMVHNGTHRPADFAHCQSEEPGVRVLTVARLTPAKGIAEGLRAVAAVAPCNPGLTYTLVGDGEGRREFEDLAHRLRLGERVRFVGYCEDVWPHLARADLFLFPSRKEALGISVIEAMLAGLPVVATSVGGVPEVVGDAGILIPLDDAFAMETALGTLIESPERRCSLARAARARAEHHFTVEAMRAGTVAVYDRLIRS